MTYLFVGALLGSIVTSGHDTREACEGRATMLREKGVIGKCVESSDVTLRRSSGVWCSGNGLCEAK